MRNEYDFTGAKRGAMSAALAKTQAENIGKERITIRLDADVLAWFKAQVAGGGNYQSLINEALKAHIAEKEGVLERVLRKVLREELHHDG